MRTRLFLLIATVLALGCSRTPARDETKAAAPATPVAATVDSSFKIETVVSNVQVPWAIVWTPDGRMLFTERAGRVRVVEKGALKPQPLFTVADVEPTGESGLMDISLHPQFTSNHFVYLTYAYKGDGQRVRVVRYRETGGTLAEPKMIIENIPAAQFHAGCRARFGP